MASRPRGLGKSLGSVEHRAFREVMTLARERAGLTQQQVAKRLQRPQSFVAKYEGGERRLDVLEFLTVTRALNADPIKILRALIRAGA